MATSGMRWSFDFCAITSRYRRKQRAPSTVAIMAMESGGRSCGVKGVFSCRHSIAAVSEGISVDP